SVMHATRSPRGAATITPNARIRRLDGNHRWSSSPTPPRRRLSLLRALRRRSPQPINRKFPALRGPNPGGGSGPAGRSASTPDPSKFLRKNEMLTDHGTKSFCWDFDWKPLTLTEQYHPLFTWRIGGAKFLSFPTTHTFPTRIVYEYVTCANAGPFG